MILTEEFVKNSMVYSEALIEEARKKRSEACFENPFHEFEQQ